MDTLTDHCVVSVCPSVEKGLVKKEKVKSQERMLEAEVREGQETEASID